MVVAVQIRANRARIGAERALRARGVNVARRLRCMACRELVGGRHTECDALM